MITEINELKTSTKHISCIWWWKFDGRKPNRDQKWNKDLCWCECKNPRKHNVSRKDYIWNPRTCTFENAKYLRSVIGDSVITYDEIIEVTKTILTETVLTNFNEKKDKV